MQFNQRQYFLVFLGGLWVTATPVAIAHNGNIWDSTGTDAGIQMILSKNVNQKANREYTFKAPDSKTLSSSSQLAAVQNYQVQVYGSSSALLHQVRKIEPTAFVKDNLIQVGTFKQQQNAENIVKQLTISGMWARIVSN